MSNAKIKKFNEVSYLYFSVVNSSRHKNKAAFPGRILLSQAEKAICNLLRYIGFYAEEHLELGLRKPI